MFKLIQFSIRFFLFLLFLVVSPIMILISIPFAKSFSEALTETIEIVVSPLKKDTYEWIFYFYVIERSGLNIWSMKKFTRIYSQ